MNEKVYKVRENLGGKLEMLAVDVAKRTDKRVTFTDRSEATGYAIHQHPSQTDFSEEAAIRRWLAEKVAPKEAAAKRAREQFEAFLKKREGR